MLNGLDYYWLWLYWIAEHESMIVVFVQMDAIGPPLKYNLDFEQPLYVQISAFIAVD